MNGFQIGAKRLKVQHKRVHHRGPNGGGGGGQGSGGSSGGGPPSHTSSPMMAGSPGMYPVQGYPMMLPPQLMGSAPGTASGASSDGTPVAVAPLGHEEADMEGAPPVPPAETHNGDPPEKPPSPEEEIASEESGAVEGLVEGLAQLGTN
mmetsp:Transcript_8309/g.23191  ORF Transcript_8309/g.23191 Transcript_8309/m.23191 type:complete len:149 (-) Transcript_8309:447-893(-)